MNREDLIQRVLQEKGTEAIPNLIRLLDERDSETRELAVDVLSVMGSESKDYLLEEFKKRFERNREDDVTLLYLTELLADLECQEIVPYLERMINNYTDERAFPIIIENLLKLTKDDKYLDILLTFMDDDSETEEIALMSITNIPSKKVVDILSEKYETSKNKSKRALIMDSMVKVLLGDFELVPYLQQINPDLSKKLQWQIENQS
ncbi:MAG: HEAT repeat domain-containing protein [Thermotogota bacterium]